MFLNRLLNFLLALTGGGDEQGHQNWKNLYIPHLPNIEALTQQGWMERRIFSFENIVGIADITAVQTVSYCEFVREERTPMRRKIIGNLKSRYNITWDSNNFEDMIGLMRACNGLDEISDRCYGENIRNISALLTGAANRNTSRVSTETANIDERNNDETSAESKSSDDCLRENIINTHGSHWCGLGKRARIYQSPGKIFNKADKCCRTHDFCPISIPKGGEKYGIQNTSPYRVYHCACEKVFNECLNEVETDRDYVSKVRTEYFSPATSRIVTTSTKDFENLRQRRCIEFNSETEEFYFVGSERKLESQYVDHVDEFIGTKAPATILKIDERLKPEN